MKDIETKREREKKMISQMIALYCHRNHHTKGCLLYTSPSPRD